MAADDMDIDPAIAEAMGFSGFGMQGKKRKHGDDDAFVGAQPQAQSETTGTAASVTTSKSRFAAPAPTADEKPSREALRQGVRNAQGHMVYFLPSFIEDPWKGLEPK